MKRLSLAFAAALFASALGGSAMAQSDGTPLGEVLFGATEPDDQLLDVSLSADGRFLKVAGDLETGSYRKVKRILAKAQGVKSLWLDSAGGLVLEGFLIGALVREARLDTYVESNCASACTLILAAGVNRAAYARAKIGFHNSIDLDKHGKPVTGRKAIKSHQEPDFMQAAAFRQTGVDASFVDRALATPNHMIWEPSHAEMIAARVLTRSLDDKDRQAFSGWGQSWPQIRDALLAQPLWAALAKAEPTFFDEVVTRAWANGQKEAGGAQALAETLLASRLADHLVLGSDAIAQRFLDLHGRARSRSVDPARCAHGSSLAVALTDLAADGLDAEEHALVTDALAQKSQSGDADPDQAQQALAAIRPLLAAADGVSRCTQVRSVLATISKREPRLRLFTLRALHLSEADD